MIKIDVGYEINTLGKRTLDEEQEWTFNDKVMLAVSMV